MVNDHGCGPWCRDDCSYCGTYGGASVYTKRSAPQAIPCEHCGSVKIDGDCVNECGFTHSELKRLEELNTELTSAIEFISHCSCDKFCFSCRMYINTLTKKY